MIDFKTTITSPWFQIEITPNLIFKKSVFVEDVSIPKNHVICILPSWIMLNKAIYPHKIFIYSCCFYWNTPFWMYCSQTAQVPARRWALGNRRSVSSARSPKQICSPRWSVSMAQSAPVKRARNGNRPIGWCEFLEKIWVEIAEDGSSGQIS